MSKGKNHEVQFSPNFTCNVIFDNLNRIFELIFDAIPTLKFILDTLKKSSCSNLRSRLSLTLIKSSLSAQSLEKIEDKMWLFDAKIPNFKDSYFQCFCSSRKITYKGVIVSSSYIWIHQEKFKYFFEIIFFKIRSSK